MSAAARLAAFAALLAAIFAGALVLGGVVGPDRGGSARADAGREMAMGGGHGAMAMDEVRGLAASEHGLTLEPARTTARAGRRFALAFRIAGRDGQAVRDFDVMHTKRMHVIVVRRDLTGFQHVHPTLAADGTWSVPVTLRDPGSYRVFADFSTAGAPKTLATDLQVDGAVRSRPLPAPVGRVAVDGLRVDLREGASLAGRESALRFSVTRHGTPVPVQDYLGAKGHLVALREGDLAFLHVHPDEDSLRFEAEFPSAGRYRLFLQFRVAGRVHTAAFTQEVGQ